MASVKFYLDKRSQKTDGTYPLKLTVTHIQPFHVNLDISVHQENWIGDKIEGNIKNKVFLNNYIKNRYIEVENLLLRLKLEGRLTGMTTRQLRTEIKYLSGDIAQKDIKEENPLHFKTYVKRHADTYVNKDSGQQFIDMLNKVSGFADTDYLLISDITVSWLKDFNTYCLKSGMKTNGVSLYLRAIRTVFNDAIDRELIGYEKYPFRRFKIKTEKTMHRNMPVEQLREMLGFDASDFLEGMKAKSKKHTSEFPEIKKYIDLFFLSFYFCGLNIKDLLFLTKEDVQHGRLYILRNKTSIPVLIKIEPEAQAIIDKYPGKKYLLSFLDSYSTNNYKDVLRRMNKNIQLVFPKISSYWARHSWATMAAELDVPDPIIDLAQGRKPSGMASIYINRNLKKISEANRKVIDDLLQKK